MEGEREDNKVEDAEAETSDEEETGTAYKTEKNRNLKMGKTCQKLHTQH